MLFEYFTTSKAVLPPASAYSPTTPLSATYRDFFYGTTFDGYLSENLKLFLSYVDYNELSLKIKNVVFYNGSVNNGFVITLSGRYQVDDEGIYLSGQTPLVNATLRYK
ncbi:MAG: hypothetical protein EBU90_22950 [Proteobacteria bacterium]|nr:hypothetical protein [Pseudomonadota bacterium]NBP15641.1 hypothetical protein [bacterium]